jgi:hypothetical protein
VASRIDETDIDQVRPNLAFCDLITEDAQVGESPPIMATKHQRTDEIARTMVARRGYLKVCVGLLLLAVIGFSTLAKNSQYRSQSDPAHFLNISSKMKVSHAPVATDRTPLQAVARFVPPRPEFCFTHVCEDLVPELPSLSVTLTLQHRSPPPSVS